MCVPGAIAATSAAMVMRNPADAARLPDGPTNTATGVFAAMIALLMSRVESSRPPGRAQREHEQRGAGGVGLLRSRERMYSATDRMDDAVDFGGVDDRRRADCGARGADRPAPDQRPLTRSTERRTHGSG